MKKKILSLLLVISLMCAFTVISFADTGGYVTFNLGNNEEASFILYGHDMDKADDDLWISVVADSSGTPEYVIEVYCLDISTTNPIKSFEHDERTCYLDYPNLVNYTDDFKVVIRNKGSVRISGSVVAIVR